MKAALGNKMLFKPLCFEYDDERSAQVEDQLLVGESIMIAPVYTQNATGRYVYLPENMKLIRFRAFDDYDEEALGAGDHYVKADLNEILVFVRKGHVLPLVEPSKGMECNLNNAEMKYICYDSDAASYELYTDDGVSRI
jgi:alpha-glucosidase